MTENIDIKACREAADKILSKWEADGLIYEHKPEQDKQAIRGFLKEWMEIVFNRTVDDKSYVNEINDGVSKFLESCGIKPESHERAVLKSVDPVPSDDGTLTFDITFEKLPFEIKILEDDRFNPDLDILEERYKQICESMEIPLNMVFPLDINDPRLKPQGVVTIQYNKSLEGKE